MALRETAVPEQLVTTYLHMTDPAEFQPSYIEGHTVMMMQMNAADLDFYRFLYGSVGAEWRWRDRLVMSDEELTAALSQPGVSVHVMYVDGIPAGYVELGCDGEETEILYFGLRSAFHGMGLGKHLLSYGIQRAWETGAKRIRVHTCNLDAPQALSNYMKRGFKIYDVHYQPMPDRYI